MYVCICNPTTDIQIIECCKDGCTLKELTENLKICSNCKSCAKEISYLFKQYSPKLINKGSSENEK